MTSIGPPFWLPKQLPETSFLDLESVRDKVSLMDLAVTLSFLERFLPEKSDEHVPSSLLSPATSSASLSSMVPSTPPPLERKHTPSSSGACCDALPAPLVLRRTISADPLISLGPSCRQQCRMQHPPPLNASASSSPSSSPPPSPLHSPLHAAARTSITPPGPTPPATPRPPLPPTPRPPAGISPDHPSAAPSYFKRLLRAAAWDLGKAGAFELRFMKAARPLLLRVLPLLGFRVALKKGRRMSLGLGSGSRPASPALGLSTAPPAAASSSSSSSTSSSSVTPSSSSPASAPSSRAPSGSLGLGLGAGTGTGEVDPVCRARPILFLLHDKAKMIDPYGRITYEQCLDAIHDLDKVFECEPVFDYGIVMGRIIKSAVSCLSRMLPHLDLSPLAELRVARTHISGEDFMIPYEVSFQTDGVREMCFPDPYRLSEQHLKLLMGPSTNRGRFFRRHFYACLKTTCHEMLHSIQALAKQVDSKHCSWSSEHDASVASNSLFWAIAQCPELKDIFQPGLAESILLYSLEGNLRTWAGWPAEYKSEYMKWRNAFGLVSPGEIISSQPRVDTVFKGLVGIENTYFEPEQLQAQLDLLFKDRTGDVYSEENVARLEARPAWMKLDRCRLRLFDLIKPAWDPTDATLAAILAGLPII